MKNTFTTALSVILAVFLYTSSHAAPIQSPNPKFNDTAFKVLKAWETLKPNVSTRRDLLKIFSYQGGIIETTFHYPGCWILVDVEFKESKSVGQTDERGHNFDDVISKISRPYLGSPAWD